MTAPLYDQLQAQKPEIAKTGNRGLWFERFYDQYDPRNWDVLKPSGNNTDIGNTHWLLTHFTKASNSRVGDADQLKRHSQQQIQLASLLNGQNHVFQSSWHFVTGMGNPHPVENGFAWHTTLGVPYLTGAAVKGLVRTFIETQLDEDDSTKKNELLLQWFGSDHKNSKEQTCDSKAGELIFFDATPIEPVTLGVDIMTPHMGKWYEKGASDNAVGSPEAVPADWHDPTPISFLVAKDIKLLFSFAIRPHPPAKEPKDTNGKRDLNLDEVRQALEAVLTQMGAGGKTVTGYGGMSHDQAAEEALAKEVSQKRLDQERQAALQAELANLSPMGVEFKKQASQGNWEKNKDTFVRPGVIEGWLDKLETEPDTTVVNMLVELVEIHFSKALLANPLAVKGKKGKEEPVFKERQQKIGKRLNSLRA